MAKIVIVEDDSMISEIYQRKFTDSGFEVEVADTGEKAVEMVSKGGVNAILLDLIMPKMSGFEVITKIRENEANKDLKILIFSNLSQKEDQEKAMKLGADGFIVKAEYTPGDLVKKVSRIMGQEVEEKKNEEREEREKEAKDKTENVPDDSNKKKVLLIEDEKIFLEMFGEKLRQDGYAVETAENGAWGIKQALLGDFDIFIIDMMMPAMTGVEIIEKLKMEEKTKNIPIIVISASVEDEMAKDVRKLGINEFFVKTQIVPSDLSKKVTELIGK